MKLDVDILCLFIDLVFLKNLHQFCFPFRDAKMDFFQKLSYFGLHRLMMPLRLPTLELLQIPSNHPHLASTFLLPLTVFVKLFIFIFPSIFTALLTFFDLPEAFGSVYTPIIFRITLLLASSTLLCYLIFQTLYSLALQIVFDFQPISGCRFIIITNLFEQVIYCF